MGANFRLDGGQLQGCDEWRAALGTFGLHAEKLVPRSGAVLSIDSFSLYGFPGVTMGCGAGVVLERNQLDARRGYNDSYCVVIQLHGKSALTQNDRVARLAVGDVAFVDMSRPAARHLEDSSNRWFGLQLPRRTLMSHLGMEPEGGVCCRGDTPAGRLLFNLISDSFHEPSSSELTQAHMRSAFYDLLGALLGTSDPQEFPTARSEALLKRVSSIVRDRFADPDFGPVEAAAEAGISIRYLQKLFAAKGLSCSRFILAVRLEHAAKLLNRGVLLRTGQPLKQVAYACGFRDYAHFSKAFTRRFGRSPSEICEQDGRPVVPTLK
jgi:AraC family transcriptional regulator, positive regulator of tynA and feaB